MYNWELPDWPDFKYQLQNMEPVWYDFARETGEVNGMLNALPNTMQQETLVQLMLTEAIKSSEIEGEYLSRTDVMSSIRNNLGLNPIPEVLADQRAAGIGALMVDVRKTFHLPLTIVKLMEWHKLLLSSFKGINPGNWRTGTEPMQVVSGRMGKETVHFEAPPAQEVPAEMDKFINWFNDTAPGAALEISNPIIRAAISHLYFESIHPFEDGNGRMGRAIAEKVLSQTIGRPVMLSLSRTIAANKTAYYEALTVGQQSNEITPWVKYFAELSLQAQKEARLLVDFTLQKTQFFDRFKAELNERQLKVITKVLDAGPAGFEGGMTAKKYMSIAKTSKATATRDLQLLTELKIFIPMGGGRNIHYTLNL
ncbi:Fic family protein [Pedobacter gandavensis]|uniref:Fic family protein n=1 Tax=Pedobacter gandavensis TaxID=2679963 RepID=UPI00292FD892|nr:Fic family protein [Pedobacter gandavensis]